jgi:hypothetical protein
MDILAGFVVILVAAALLLRWMPRTAHGLDFFASGFLPYRDPGAGWPHGVQEEDVRPWSWRPANDETSDAPGAGQSTGWNSGPELVDIDVVDAPEATVVGPWRWVHRGPTHQG